MRATELHLQWLDTGLEGRFRTGVSLHSHTFHSRESLNFFYQVARHSAPLRWALRQAEAAYFRHHGEPLDLNCGWWTPPLGPRQAYSVEAAQIAALGLAPIVSLTDHDDIEAPMTLQAMDASLSVPISVEWTVPYRGTFFHLGIHNVAPHRARTRMDTFAAFTACPEEARLPEILESLHGDESTLIVLNHPFWDEAGIGAGWHHGALMDLLAAHSPWIHAIEINGLRPWEENRSALRLAAESSKPAVAGGDRHVLEPNAVLNLTSAPGIAEFASEVRDGLSHILVLPSYRAPYTERILHNVLDVFRTYADHGRGWTEWPDRVFFTLPGGTVESLQQIWGGRPPVVVNLLDGIMRFTGQPSVRNVLRAVLPTWQEVLP